MFDVSVGRTCLRNVLTRAERAFRRSICDESGEGGAGGGPGGGEGPRREGEDEFEDTKLLRARGQQPNIPLTNVDTYATSDIRRDRCFLCFFVGRGGGLGVA